jgi:nicotinamide phosphoribosyltransferase
MNRYAPIRPLIRTDGYKLDHRRQYPEGTAFIQANWTPRGSRLDDVTHVTFFGLQAFLQNYLTEQWDVFFRSPKEVVTKRYQEFIDAYVGPNSIGVDHIAALWELGYLPLRFNALPEGKEVPLRVPMFTVENTVAEFYWLVNYIETPMSSEIWQGMTAATLARRFRKLLDRDALETTGQTATVDFQGHDFSFRGDAGIEAAERVGAGHLLSFLGTDSMPSIDWLDQYYTVWGPEGDDYMIGGSVPATEHSVMCAGGNDEGDEQATFERLLELYPTGIFSAVSDTWDLWNVLTVILPNLKEKILAREGKLVIRPDSGDPVDILCGTLTAGFGYKTDLRTGEVVEDYRTPEEKGVIELLWEVFGGTKSEQGYKVLDEHIGAIYGDAITYERAEQINARLKAKGFASINWVAGVGSYTYQYNTRDTFGFAMKSTWTQDINGVEQAIYKDPITDSGLKRSARSRVAVVINSEGEYELVDGLTRATEDELSDRNELRTVWEDGYYLEDQHLNLRQIRANVGLVK